MSRGKSKTNPLHRRTGRRKGAPVDNAHALKHGRTTAAALAQRKAVMALVRRCREAAEMARLNPP